MSEELLCPSCHQPVEAGAVFCGNCGQQLMAGQSKPVTPVPVAPAAPTVQSPSTIANVYVNGQPAPQTMPAPTQLAPAGANPIPSYAVASPVHKQHWAAMAIAFAILGIGGSLLIPLIGLVFGITGIVLTTSSYHVTGKRLRLVSLILSILALFAGITMWVYAIQHDPKLHPQAGTTSGVATISVTTPCYSVKFSKELNVNNSSGSCALNAYNGTTLDTSTEVYKVLVSQAASLTATNFNSFAKPAIEGDIAKNLPGFTVTAEASDLFQGSTGYYVQAADSSENLAVIEEAVFHPTVNSSATDNLYVIVHALNGNSVNLNALKNAWQWND